MNVKSLFYIFIVSVIIIYPVFSEQDNDFIRFIKFSRPLKNSFEKGYQQGLKKINNKAAVIRGYQTGFKTGENSVQNELADYHCGIELENYSDIEDNIEDSRLSSDDLNQIYLKKAYVMGVEKGEWVSKAPEFKRAFIRGFEYGQKEAFHGLEFNDSEFKLTPRDQIDLGVSYASRSQNEMALFHLNYLIKSYKHSEYWSLALLRAGTLNSSLGRHYDAGCCFYAYFHHFPNDKVKVEVLLNFIRELYLLSNAGGKTYYSILLFYSKKVLLVSNNMKYKAEALFYIGVSYEKLRSYKDSERSYRNIINNYKTTSFYRKALKRVRNLRKNLK